MGELEELLAVGAAWSALVPLVPCVAALLGDEDELLLGEVDELRSLLEEFRSDCPLVELEELLPRVELPCIPAICCNCWSI